MRKPTRAAVVALSLALAIAACSDDDESDAAGTAAAAASDTTSAASGSGVEAAQAIIDQFADPATAIGPTIPLDGVPEPKTVAWLQCELPDCATFGAAFEEATAALGWELQTISVQSFDPSAGFQQAIDAGVDYIAITGTPAALIQEQIDNARAAGIGFFSCYATDDPDPALNIFMQCGDDTNVSTIGGILSNWIIADSGGTAHTLFVNLPDFPVLVAEGEGARAAYEENCPACTFDELDVTIDQLTAGEVPAAVVSQLQADESIDYVHFAFGSLPTGVAEAIEAARLSDRVTLTGVDFDVAVGLQGIADGKYAAWTANPKPYASWLMVDAMARHALGMDNPEERDNALLPTFIVDSVEEAESVLEFGPDGWPGPEGFEQAFMALWGVG